MGKFPGTNLTYVCNWNFSFGPILSERAAKGAILEVFAMGTKNLSVGHHSCYIFRKGSFLSILYHVFLAPGEPGNFLFGDRNGLLLSVHDNR